MKDISYTMTLTELGASLKICPGYNIKIKILGTRGIQFKCEGFTDIHKFPMEETYENVLDLRWGEEIPDRDKVVLLLKTVHGQPPCEIEYEFWRPG